MESKIKIKVTKEVGGPTGSFYRIPMPTISLDGINYMLTEGGAYKQKEIFWVPDMLFGDELIEYEDNLLKQLQKGVYLGQFKPLIEYFEYEIVNKPTK